MVAVEERSSNHRMAKKEKSSRDNGKATALSQIEQNGVLKTTK